MVWRAMRSMMSFPDTAGRGAMIPDDTGCAQTGNQPAIAAAAAPPPKAALTNPRLSSCIFFPTVSAALQNHTQVQSATLHQNAPVGVSSPETHKTELQSLM